MITDAPHYIEIDWKAATAVGANNGMITLWVDWTQKSSITYLYGNGRSSELGRAGVAVFLRGEVI